MIPHRALEVILGVVTLVSVVSVPVPRKGNAIPPVPVNRPRLNVQQLEELHRTSQAQREDVARLARDTRILSETLRSHIATSHGDGGTVRAPDTRVPENEYECSQ
jgi:hypothetical protein